MRFLSERVRQERNAALLGSVTAVRAVAAAAEPRVSELSDSAGRLLIAAALTPSKRLLELYDELSLHAAEGKSSVNELVARAMVRPWRLIRKGRGGQPTVLEVLPSGVAELQKRGIKPAEQLVRRGSFKHSIYCGEVGRHFKEQRAKSVWFERTLGEKSFDVLAESSAGELTGVEVILTGSAAWNTSQLLRAAGVEGVASVIAAFEDRQLLKGVEAGLRETDALGLYRPKLRLASLAEFVRV